jgi:hypothetical protein
VDPSPLLAVVAAVAAVIAPAPDAAARATVAAQPRPAACVGRCWRPARDATFTYQLTGRIRTGTPVDVYGVDAVDVPGAAIRRLRASGRRVVCYVSGGSHESWRSDASAFPAEVIGEPLDGWPGERWLDVRRLNVLAPIMRARIRACARRGFDGIDFDNVAGYQAETGFDLTAADQLRYNRWLADEAHRFGLAVALKNDPSQATALEPWFDMSIVEQCVQYGECARYRPFVRARKPVFIIEYEGSLARACRIAGRLGMHVAMYTLALDGPRRACPRA